ncbi:MAG: radical SAM protein [Prevotellaceae bacterium]|nr:radical SAM protein [Prevotellaceae bacterium]
MDIEQLIIPPRTIALSTTYQCSAACKNCCFGCNPIIKDRLSLQEMKDYVDQSMEYYGDSIGVLVLTGGECFLGYDLTKIVEYGASKELIV